MNVLLPEKHNSNKRIIISVIILIICIIAIAVAVFQFFSDEKLEVILGFTSSTDEEYEILKSGFEKMFTNTLEKKDNDENIDKVYKEKDVIYTMYQKQENVTNNYDMNVQIPYININSDIVKKYNEEIQRNFLQVAENILRTQNRNYIYTVEYKAVISNNILSIAIRSNFKQGGTAQRVIIQTYNYDLQSNKEITLKELLNAKNISDETAENEISLRIRKAQEEAKELKELGYNIYQRNYGDNMYLIKNTTEYFTDGEHIYLIYAYGNNINTETSEMDLVIL